MPVDADTAPSLHALHAAERLRPALHAAPPARAVPPPLQGATRRMYGYLPYWTYDVADVPFAHLTDLAVFSVSADADGSLSDLSNWTGRAADAVRLGHAAGVRVHLCVTQFDRDTLDSILGSATSRERLVTQVAQQIRAYGADGVNIDFEGVRAGQRANMVRLVRELKAAQVGDVTLATPAVDWSDAWDYAALAEASDGLFIMGYEYHWSGGDPGPNAPLAGGSTWGTYSLSSTVNDYRSAGAAADKILLGLPLYGHTWPVSDANAVPGDATGRASSITYGDTFDAAGRRWDADSTTPWYPGSGTQTWYDDLESVEAKVRWALLDQDLGGVGFWALGYEANDAAFWGAMDTVMDEAATRDAPPEDTAMTTTGTATHDTGAVPSASKLGADAEACGCTTPGTPPGAALALAAWLGVRARRRRT
jgi:uncharacterized protein (TIGR03382 family)